MLVLNYKQRTKHHSLCAFHSLMHGKLEEEGCSLYLYTWNALLRTADLAASPSCVLSSDSLSLSVCVRACVCARLCVWKEASEDEACTGWEGFEGDC